MPEPTTTDAVDLSQLVLNRQVQEGVYELRNPDTGEVFYAKRVSKSEQEMTVKASDYGAKQKDDAILQFPEVVDRDGSSLPADIFAKIKGDNIEPRHGATISEVIVTRAVPDGITLARAPEPVFLESLNGKPITADEYAQLQQEVTAMNKAGVVNDDLVSNANVTRGEDGKLHIYSYDYDPVGINAGSPAQPDADIKAFVSLRKYFEEYGAVEPSRAAAMQTLPETVEAARGAPESGPLPKALQDVEGIAREGNVVLFNGEPVLGVTADGKFEPAKNIRNFGKFISENPEVRAAIIENSEGEFSNMAVQTADKQKRAQDEKTAKAAAKAATPEVAETPDAAERKPVVYAFDGALKEGELREGKDARFRSFSPVEEIKPGMVITVAGAEHFPQKGKATDHISKNLRFAYEAHQTFNVPLDKVASFVKPKDASIEDAAASFVDDLLMPRVSQKQADGTLTRLPVEEAAANMRISIITHSFGGDFASSVGQQFAERMENLGYSPQEVQTVTKQVLQVDYAPSMPFDFTAETIGRKPQTSPFNRVQFFGTKDTARNDVVAQAEKGTLAGHETFELDTKRVTHRWGSVFSGAHDRINYDAAVDSNPALKAQLSELIASPELPASAGQVLAEKTSVQRITDPATSKVLPRQSSPEDTVVEDGTAIKAQIRESAKETLKKATANWQETPDGSLIMRNIPNAQLEEVQNSLLALGVDAKTDPKLRGVTDIVLTPEQRQIIEPAIGADRIMSATPSQARTDAQEKAATREEITQDILKLKQSGDARRGQSREGEPAVQFKGTQAQMLALQEKLQSNGLDIPSYVGTLPEGDTVLQVKGRENIEALKKLATVPLDLEKLTHKFASAAPTDAVKVMMQDMANNGDIRKVKDLNGGPDMLQIRGDKEALAGLQKTLAAEMQLPEGEKLGGVRDSKSAGTAVLQIQGEQIAAFEARFPGVTDALPHKFSNKPALLSMAPDDTADIPASRPVAAEPDAATDPGKTMDTRRMARPGGPKNLKPDAAMLAGMSDDDIRKNGYANRVDPEELDAARAEARNKARQRDRLKSPAKADDNIITTIEKPVEPSPAKADTVVEAKPDASPADLAKLDKGNEKKTPSVSVQEVALEGQYNTSKQLLRLIDSDPNSIQLSPEAAKAMPQVAEYQKLATQAAKPGIDTQEATQIRERMNGVETKIDTDFKGDISKLRSAEASQTRLTGMSMAQNTLGVLQAGIALQNIDSMQGMSDTEKTVRKAMAWTQIASGTAGVAVDARSLANPATKLGASFGVVTGGIGVVSGVYDFSVAARNGNTEGMVLSGANVGVSGMSVASSYLSLAGKSPALAAGLGIGAAGAGAVLAGYNLRVQIMANTEGTQQRDAELERTESRFAFERRAGVTDNFSDVGLPLKPELREYKELNNLDFVLKQAGGEGLDNLASNPAGMEKSLMEFNSANRKSANEHLAKAQARIDFDSTPLLQPSKFIAGAITGRDYDTENQRYMDSVFQAKEYADRGGSALREMRGEFGPDGTEQPRGFSERMNQYQQVLAPLENEYPRQIAQLEKLRDNYMVTANSDDKAAVIKALGFDKDPYNLQRLEEAYKLPKKERNAFIGEELAKKNFSDEMARVEAMSPEQQQAYFDKNKEFVAKAKLEKRDDLGLVSLSTSAEEFQQKKIMFAPKTVVAQVEKEGAQFERAWVAIAIESRTLTPVADKAAESYTALTSEKPKDLPVLDEKGEPVLNKDGTPRTVDQVKQEIKDGIERETKQIDAIYNKMADKGEVDYDADAVAKIKSAGIERMQLQLAQIERQEKLYKIAQAEEAKQAFREQTASLFEKAGDKPIVMDKEMLAQVERTQGLAKELETMREAQRKGEKVDLAKLEETEKKFLLEHRALGEKVAGAPAAKDIAASKDAPEAAPEREAGARIDFRTLAKLDTFDANKDGVIDKKEGEKITTGSVDANHDGKVDKAEFAALKKLASSDALQDIVERMKGKVNFDPSDIAALQAPQTPLANNPAQQRGGRPT